MPLRITGKCGKLRATQYGARRQNWLDGDSPFRSTTSPRGNFRSVQMLMLFVAMAIICAATGRLFGSFIEPHGNGTGVAVLLSWLCVGLTGPMIGAIMGLFHDGHVARYTAYGLAFGLVSVFFIIAIICPIHRRKLLRPIRTKNF